MLLLAELADGIFALVPIMALMIPIVVIWSKHRLSLEELRSRRHGEESKLATDVEELRNDVRELKDHLHQQMIAVDNLLSNQEKMMTGARPAEEIKDRLGIGNG